MDGQLRVSAIILVSVLCVCFLVPADSAAVHSRVSADTVAFVAWQVGVRRFEGNCYKMQAGAATVQNHHQDRNVNFRTSVKTQFCCRCVCSG